MLSHPARRALASWGDNRNGRLIYGLLGARPKINLSRRLCALGCFGLLARPRFTIGCDSYNCACAFSASHWQVVVDLLRIGQFHVVSLAAATESELAARVKLATLPVAPCDPCEAGAFGVGLLKLSKGLWSSSSRGRELALREAHAAFRSSLDSDAFGLPYEREESKRRGCLGGRQVKFSSLLDENGTPRSTRNRSPPEI